MDRTPAHVIVEGYWFFAIWYAGSQGESGGSVVEVMIGCWIQKDEERNGSIV
jgi:hypothetical protein